VQLKKTKIIKILKSASEFFFAGIQGQKKKINVDEEY
jgi:hypothetical protein